MGSDMRVPVVTIALAEEACGLETHLLGPRTSPDTELHIGHKSLHPSLFKFAPLRKCHSELSVSHGGEGGGLLLMICLTCCTATRHNHLRLDARNPRQHKCLSV
ncbi:unnamed protein product [Rangifer tarandus platyrhynchus]|uniref:Uncharacterized protein n=2 Tax=Rangifer tarandus platyrhynchus TaxID=3082113 RepID=A0AC59ZIY6_RANTA|nr:unnamed protein product [Rangifer tarandus platyrhynchus]